MPAAVEALLEFNPMPEWHDTILRWLTFEHKIGYPEGQVSSYCADSFIPLTTSAVPKVLD
jgi:hypothetical protein